MSFLQLNLPLLNKEAEADVLIALLSEFGFDGFHEEVDHLSAFMSYDNFSERAWKAYVDAHSFLQEYKFTLDQVDDINWNKEWESNYPPIYLDHFCQIIAPFHLAKKDFEYTLKIEPKMSFGTGHHDTTQLMIHLMREIDFKDKNVLDMGSGTGVLSILAAKMGAKRIDAIDIDNWAYENIQENISRNEVQVYAHKGDVNFLEELSQTYDVILANINKNILLSDVPSYLAQLQRGGFLLLSGFLPNDESDLDQIPDLSDTCRPVKKVSTKNWMAKCYQIIA